MIVASNRAQAGCLGLISRLLSSGTIKEGTAADVHQGFQAAQGKAHGAVDHRHPVGVPPAWITSRDIAAEIICTPAGPLGGDPPEALGATHM